MPLQCTMFVHIRQSILNLPASTSANVQRSVLENQENMIKDFQGKMETAKIKPLAGGTGGGKDADDKEYKNGNKTGK